MKTAVRLPRLLGGDFRESRRLRPISLSLSLERAACSTAELALPDTEEPLPLFAFLELYTARGSAGLFRVTADAAPTFGAYTYPLRHAIDTLHDSVWKAQTDFSGTMAAFLAALLSQQTVPYWQLGQCQDAGSWKREDINYDRLDDLLDEVREDRREYMFTYDFSTTPWTLNFVRVSDSVDAEMRLTRNLSEATLRRTRDGMGNRLYLSISTTALEEDGSPGETTVEYRTYNDADSQAIYGPVEISAAVDSADVSDPDAWAAQFLREHALPIAQASAEGWEIVKATGEPWDQMDLGKRCRLAAKRAGFPAEFPIEVIKYDNLFGDDPDRVHIDMNRKLPRFSERLAKVRETAERAYGAARGAGARIKKNEEVDAHYQRIVKSNKEGMEDCFGVIGVKLDPDTHEPMRDTAGNYIWADAEDAAAEIWGHFHRTAWETLIANVVKDGEGNVLSIAQVSTSADGKFFVDAINESGTGTAQINANRVHIQSTSGSGIELDNNGNISLNAGETVNRINGQSGSGAVYLNAAMIHLNGSAIVSGSGNGLIAPEGWFTDLYAGSGGGQFVVEGSDIRAYAKLYAEGGIDALDGATVNATNGAFTNLSVGNANVANAVDTIGPATASGGQISIPWTKLDGSSGTVNFNMADYVSALIVDGNDVPVSGPRTLAGGGTLTLYPATYMGGVTARNAPAALVITAADGADTVTLASYHTGEGSQTATTDEIKFLDKSQSGNALDVRVGVRLSNGKQYSRTITGISFTPPSPSVGNWQINSLAGGGTRVWVDVNGTTYHHDFNNYP